MKTFCRSNGVQPLNARFAFMQRVLAPISTGSASSPAVNHSSFGRARISPTFYRACLCLVVLFCVCVLEAKEGRRDFSDSIAPIGQSLKAGRGMLTRATLRSEETKAPVDFSISLRMRNLDELQARIRRGENISREQLEAYLPSADDYAKVSDWLTDEGFTLTLRDSNHTTVFIRGTVAQIARTFGVNFSRVSTKDGEFSSVVTTPSIPEIPGLSADAILGINGLQPHIRAHTRRSSEANPSIALPQAVSQPITGSPGYLAPVDIAAAYQAPANLNGAGQTIAIIMDAIPLTSDLTAFRALCGMDQSLGNYSVVNVAGGPADTGITNPHVGEATLDVEWASGLAPGAMVRLYAIPTLNANDIQAACVQILNDAATAPSLRQISMSFGNAEVLWSASSMLSSAQVFAQLAAQGVTVFAASGDGGSNPNVDGTNGYNSANPAEVSYPASDPSVIAVGGTVLSVNQDGSVANETAWSYSGGGVSNFFYRPDWQTGPGVPDTPTSSEAMRCVPDIAAVAFNSGTLQNNAGNTTSPQATLVVLNGMVQGMGGTSLACPVWTAFGAIINQARAQKSLPSVGLLGPRVYPLMGTASFTDVTSGNNGAYAAGAGYDLCTGIGVPNLTNLVNRLSNGPAIRSASSTAFVVGTAGNFMVMATGTPAPTFSAMGLPAWATLDSVTGTLTGTPPSLAGSPFTVTLIATNGIEPRATQTFTLNVNQAPTITSADHASFVVGSAGSFMVTTTGTPKPTISATGLPSWAVFDSTTGVVSGTPTGTTGSPFTVTLTASNGVMLNATQSFTLIIDPASGMAFTSPDHAIFGVGLPIQSWRFSAVGNPAPVFSATGLPSWATVSRDGYLTGSPPTTVGSPITIIVTAHNGVSPDVTQNFTFVVWAPHGSTSGLATTTLAGQAPANGAVDGATHSARFNSPFGVAMDDAGNIYIADRGNNVIRKVTPAGGVSTLAGTAGTHGLADGTGSAARFNNPSAVAVDSAGNVYVADTWNSLIRKITPARVVTTLAGHYDSNIPMPGKTLASIRVDGIGSSAGFGFPTGIAVDSSGNVFVGDSLTVRKITPLGVVSTLAGQAGASGSADGTGATAQFNGASGLALDPGGNLYVAEENNHTIRKITPAGVVTTVAGLAGVHGDADGLGSLARFWNPTGITLDSTGDLYVADSANDTVRKITAAGFVSTLAGSAAAPQGGADGLGVDARFSMPTGVVADASGNLYVADSQNHAIRKITPIGVATTFVGPASTGSADGVGSDARFFNPTGVAVDNGGNLYVADADNCLIRKITSSGAVTTLAGRAQVPGFSDGAGSLALFGEQTIDGVMHGPSGVAVDGAGNVYVADPGNSTVRKITPSGIVTTFAGLAFQVGSNDGIGNSARFSRPFGVAVDSVGNVYVSDAGNSTIRKITPARVVTTLAGHADSAGSADGTGDGARFDFPYGLAVDATGTVYVADYNNQTIRKISPAGVVTTLAGKAHVSGEDDGVGSLARFYYPAGVAVAANGDLYVADSLNGAIRKVTPSGVVTTELAGGIGSTDGVGSQVAFNMPMGLALDGGGNIYVADSLNNTIRKVVHGGPVFTTWPVGQTVDLGKSASFNVVMSGTAPFSFQWYKDDYSGSGFKIIPGATNSSYSIAAMQRSDLGSYEVQVTNSLGSVMSEGVPLGFRFVNTTLPVFDLSPQSQIVTTGGNASFSVSVVGSDPTTFQWQESTDSGSSWAILPNGATYSGVAMSHLTIINVTSLFNGYQYRCIASNSMGSTPSVGAVLTVLNGGVIPVGFDVQGYLNRYPDVAAVYGSDSFGAWVYYRDHGIYQGEVYDDLFRVEEYLALYPDLSAVFGNNLSGALLHWLTEGRVEGRLGRIPVEFSAAGYFTRNPDVATAVNNDPLLAWGHYWLYGIYEGRAYDDELRVFEYLAVNADLTAAFVNDWRQAALHWMRYGRTEGRLGRLALSFNVTEYLNRNPDVLAVFGTNPTTVFLHYWAYGIDENRTYDDLFRPDEYLSQNPDLVPALGTDRRKAFKHWVRYGQTEGRKGKNP